MKIIFWAPCVQASRDMHMKGSLVAIQETRLDMIVFGSDRSSSSHEIASPFWHKVVSGHTLASVKRLGLEWGEGQLRVSWVWGDGEGQLRFCWGWGEARWGWGEGEDDFRITSGLLQIDFRMTSGWLPDDFRMTTGWLHTEWRVCTQTSSAAFDIKYLL